MTIFLERWKPYLSVGDYDYLQTFVTNIKHNLPNDKMVILSGKDGRNGKTTLINEIIQYIGENNCHDCNLHGDSFLLPIKPLIVITGGIDNYNKKYMHLLKHTVTFNQSIITDTIRVDNVAPILLDVSRIIDMFHKF
jgi:hypothetical protein